MAEAIVEGERVLVTGASGFVGGYVVKQCLFQGYNVRATVRNIQDKQTKYDYLYSFQITPNTLEIVRADLFYDDQDHWTKLIAGCKYVIHIAAVLPDTERKKKATESEFVDVAMSGMKKILTASKETNVKKVIITSSIVAMGEQNKTSKKYVSFNDKSWGNDKENGLCPYPKQKILSEKYAWSFMEEHNDPFELISICPGYIIGPFLVGRKPVSVDVIKILLNSELPFGLNAPWGVPLVDIRAVALAHVNALKYGINHKRYICSNHHMWMIDITRCLNQQYKYRGYSLSEITGYPLLIDLYATFFDPVIKNNIVPTMGVYKFVDNTQCIKDLKVEFKCLDQSIQDTAECLIENGYIDDPKKRKNGWIKYIVSAIGIAIFIASISYAIHQNAN